IIPINEDLHRPGHIGPFGEELSLGREQLNAAILAIRHKHPAGAVQRDAMRQIELAGAAARFSPGEQQPAVGAELVDTGVAIAIRNVNRSIRRQCYIRWPMERWSHTADRAVIDAVDAGITWPTTG